MTQAQTDSAERIEEEIIRSARSNHQKLPVLEVIFDRFALGLGPVLKAYCAGASAEAELEAFEYMSCGEALDSLSPQSLALVTEVQPWDGSIGLILDPELLFATLEIMLGGRSAAQTYWTPRAYSTIEKRFGQRLCEVALEALTEAFVRLFEVQFQVDRIEGSPQALVLAAPSTPCVKVTMKITLEERGGTLIFLLPQTSFESVRPQLAAPFRGGQLGGDSSWRELLNDSLHDTAVSVDAVLHEPSLQLSDILNWSPGRTIDLGIHVDQEVTVACGELKMFTAAIGRRRNGAVALRINRDFSEEEEPKDVAFD